MAIGIFRTLLNLPCPAASADGRMLSPNSRIHEKSTSTSSTSWQIHKFLALELLTRVSLVASRNGNARRRGLDVLLVERLGGPATTPLLAGAPG